MPDPDNIIPGPGQFAGDLPEGDRSVYYAVAIDVTTRTLNLLKQERDAWEKHKKENPPLFGFSQTDDIRSIGEDKP